MEANKLLGSGQPSEHAAGTAGEKAFEGGDGSVGDDQRAAVRMDRGCGPATRAGAGRHWWTKSITGFRFIEFQRLKWKAARGPAGPGLGAPATFTWATGTQAWGMIPVRRTRRRKIARRQPRRSCRGRRSGWTRAGRRWEWASGLFTTDAADDAAAGSARAGVEHCVSVASARNGGGDGRLVRAGIWQKSIHATGCSQFFWIV